MTWCSVQKCQLTHLWICWSITCAEGLEKAGIGIWPKISLWATFCVSKLCDDKNLTQICAASVTFCAECESCCCTQRARFRCMHKLHLLGALTLTSRRENWIDFGQTERIKTKQNTFHCRFCGDLKHFCRFHTFLEWEQKTTQQCTTSCLHTLSWLDTIPPLSCYSPSGGFGEALCRACVLLRASTCVEGLDYYV